MNIESKVKADFLSAIKTHKMTILHDDGLYRHIEFKTPGTMCQMFNIVTFPGHLSITGDMGNFSFERVEDMFTFFRMDDNDFMKDRVINPYYWSEKIPIPKPEYKTFSEDSVRQNISDYVVDGEWPSDAVEAAEEEIENEMEGDYHAHQLIADFSFYADDGAKYQFYDSFEMDFTEYSFHFLWLLFAIVHGISQYDAEKNTKGTENE